MVPSCHIPRTGAEDFAHLGHTYLQGMLEVQGSSKDVCGELGCVLRAFFPRLGE